MDSVAALALRQLPMTLVLAHRKPRGAGAGTWSCNQIATGLAPGLIYGEMPKVEYIYTTCQVAEVGAADSTIPRTIVLYLYRVY
jgi:hypothetical protein